MVKNAELFKKLMKSSRKLRMAAFENRFGKKTCNGEMPAGPHFMKPGMSGMHGMHGMHKMGFGPFGPMGPKAGMRCHKRGLSRERMLVIISEYPDGVRQKELAERAEINASSTSEVVNKLEDDGYIVRTVDATDKRATILKLTDLGQARAEEIKEEREGFMEDFFAKLTEDEKENLSNILDKLLAE